jgi:hypothetical protein
VRHRALSLPNADGGTAVLCSSVVQSEVRGGFAPATEHGAFGAKGAEEKTTSIRRSQGVISHTLQGAPRIEAVSPRFCVVLLMHEIPDPGACHENKSDRKRCPYS